MSCTEGKKVRTKLHLRIRTEKFAHEKLERAFQVRHAHVFVDVESLNLVELRTVRRVELVPAIGRSG